MSETDILEACDNDNKDVVATLDSLIAADCVDPWDTDIIETLHPIGTLKRAKTKDGYHVTTVSFTVQDYDSNRPSDSQAILTALRTLANMRKRVLKP